MSMTFPELLERIRDEKFVEIYSACSRRIRHMLESRFAKKGGKGGKVHLKQEKDRRADALAVRAGVVAAAEEQMAEELIKTWLFGKRPMLKAALDFMGVPNDDGITEGELDALEKADAAKLGELVEHLLKGGFPIEEIAIYLAFVKAEHFDEVAKLKEGLPAPGAPAP